MNSVASVFRIRLKAEVSELSCYVLAEDMWTVRKFSKILLEHGIKVKTVELVRDPPKLYPHLLDTGTFQFVIYLPKKVQQEYVDFTITPIHKKPIYIKERVYSFYDHISQLASTYL